MDMLRGRGDEDAKAGRRQLSRERQSDQGGQSAERQSQCAKTRAMKCVWLGGIHRGLRNKKGVRTSEKKGQVGGSGKQKEKLPAGD